MWKRLDRDLVLLQEMLKHSKTQAIVYPDITSSKHVLASAHIPRRLRREAVRINDSRVAVLRISQAPRAIRMMAKQHLAQVSIPNTLGDEQSEIRSRQLLSYYVDPRKLEQARLLQQLSLACKSSLFGKEPLFDPIAILLAIDKLDPPLRGPQEGASSFNEHESEKADATLLRDREVKRAAAVSIATLATVVVLLFYSLLPIGTTSSLLILLSMPSLLHATALQFRQLLVGLPSCIPYFTVEAEQSLPVCIAIPVLVGSSSQLIDVLSTALENAVADKTSHFVYLTDFCDSDTGLDSPEERRLLADLVEGLKRISTMHGTRFYVLHRDREYSASQNRYIGKERKRGKIDALNSYILGEPVTQFSFRWGNVDTLRSFEHVLVIDEDTRVYGDTAQRLSSCCLSRTNGTHASDVDGLIFCPASFTRGRSSGRMSWLEATFAPFSPKYRSLSNDLFGETLYTGKGLYRVRNYAMALRGKLPDDCVLSHDTVEGSWLRPQLVPTAIISESFPSSHSAYISRNHRWARGDLQNAILLAKQLLLGSKAPFGPSRAVVWYIGFALVSRLALVASPFLIVTLLSETTKEAWRAALVASLIFLAAPLASMTFNALSGRRASSSTPASFVKNVFSSVRSAILILTMAMNRSLSMLSALTAACVGMSTGRRTMDWVPSSHRSEPSKWLTLLGVVALPSAYCFLAWGRINIAQATIVLSWAAWHCFTSFAQPGKWHG